MGSFRDFIGQPSKESSVSNAVENWASTDLAVQLDAAPATAFAPTSPSAYLHIDQAAL